MVAKSQGHSGHCRTIKRTGLSQRDCNRSMTGLSQLSSHLVRRLSHELFGVLSPDGRHGDDPADLPRGHLMTQQVVQLVQRLTSEEGERMREHEQRRDALAVSGRDVGVQIQTLPPADRVSVRGITGKASRCTGKGGRWLILHRRRPVLDPCYDPLALS